MNLHFFKYQGTGNDFILIDNLKDTLPGLSRTQVASLCDRRFGVGADGLMLLETSPDADFRMVYYNADGCESTMCGNGGRCIVAFASRLGLIRKETTFTAVDGLHHAVINEEGTVSLQMQDVAMVDHQYEYSILNTGSPHYVRWVDNAAVIPVFAEGRRIRNEERFAPGGINVNFVQRVSGNELYVRTYERGVEDETLSCGTGVTAAAIAASGHQAGSFTITITTPGGTLSVSFDKNNNGSASKVVLTGEATFVFEGDIIIPG
jgi:diaminopimelate epimerase